MTESSTGFPRILVPRELRRQVYEDLHNPTHPGAKATVRLAASRYIWPSMKKDIKMWAKTCLGCQRGKIQRHQKPPIEAIPIPQRRFTSIHVDLVGPLKESNGCRYMLTVIDRTTRFPLAVPIADITTETVWRALLVHWISIFGFPSTIISDRGAQFTSSTWKTLCIESGIDHQLTTAFHPQSNGMVERLHRRLKEALRSRGSADTWANDLPLVLLGLRVTPREDDMSMSPAERVFGSATSIPSSFPDLRQEESGSFPSRMQNALENLTPPPTRPPPPSRPVFYDPKLQDCSHVFIRRDGHKKPLEPLYDGPYKVVSRGRRHFTVQLGDKTDTVTIERLKPVSSATSPTEAVPRRRGRPRKTTLSKPDTKSSSKTTSTTSSSSTTTFAPKRRGRPPKTTSTSSKTTSKKDDDDDWILVQPRRRRGLPSTPPRTRSSTTTTTRRGRPSRTS